MPHTMIDSQAPYVVKSDTLYSILQHLTEEQIIQLAEAATLAKKSGSEIVDVTIRFKNGHARWIGVGLVWKEVRHE